MAQPLDAKVLTPTGWRLMGEIAVGDEIINPEGGTTHVVEVRAEGERSVYRVEFGRDSSSTEVDRQHLFQVRLRNDDKAPWRVERLGWLRSRLSRLSRQARPYLPLVASIEFAGAELPLDPYVVGSLLGNGCISTQSVQYSSRDGEQMLAVQERLPEGIAIRVSQGGSAYTFGVTQGMKGKQRSPLLTSLRELDLLGLRSHEKFVPDIYKFARPENRLAVLQGLMDTDGHARPGEAQFGTTSPWLARDVQFLVQSLGGTARIVEKDERTYKHPDGTERPTKRYYTMNVGLSPSCNPFLLARKAEAWVRQREPSRRVKSIAFIGRKPVQCLVLDSNNGLYVTDDFIVTLSRVKDDRLDPVGIFRERHGLRSALEFLRVTG
jgi:hypothetical protein